MPYDSARSSSRLQPGSQGETLAHGLGIFSLVLGAAEVLAPRTLARALGMTGSESLIAGYGLREIATGIGILTSEDPTNWIRGRVAGDAEGCPEDWMGVGEDDASLRIDDARPIDQGEHGTAQCLGARQRRLCRLAAERVGGEQPRRARLDRPVGDQQGARPGIEEGASQPRHRFRPGALAGSRVAGREDDPVGVELEAKNLL